MLGMDSETPYHRVGRRDDDVTLHLILGLALGWISVPALSVEAAQLQLDQPEGLALTALTGAVGTIGNTVIVPGFLIVQRWAALDVDTWVRIALAGQLGVTLLGALLYNVTTDGWSITLYMISFVGSLAANLQRLAAMPWVMQGGGSPACVSWLLAGGNMTALVCALLGVIQQPGGEMRLSVGAYFGSLTLLVLGSIVAYALLLRRRPPATPRPQQAKLGLCEIPTFATNKEVVKCTGTNALVQTICWVMIGFFLPYASEHAAGSTRDGSVLLGYTAEASTIAVFVGSVVSAYGVLAQA